MRTARTLLVGTLLASAGASCAVVVGIEEVSVPDDGVEAGAQFTVDDASLPVDDTGVPVIAFDAEPVDAGGDAVVVDAPPDAPYVATWSTGAFAACSDALCGGTQCRPVFAATFKSDPPSAPQPFTCQTCSPKCCDCPDLGSNWFYDNAQGQSACAAKCADGCIRKYRQAITEQQNKGCVLRQTTCQKGFGCP